MSSWNERQAAKAAQRRDELAELVAEGATVIEAAAAMGLSYGMAKKLWQRIRRDMGWQAC